MDSIEYIEEDVREEIAVFILDSNRNGEFNNEEIFELIRRSGVAFDIDNIEISSTNENGLNRVVVYRKVKRNVPYKVERTLIGDFPLDTRLSTDAQRDRAYALMHLAGLDVSDESKFEIITKKDDMGRIIAYEVYQIQKTRLQEDKSIVLSTPTENKMISTIEELRNSLEKLKEMRAQLDSMESGLEKSQAIQSLAEEVKSLEEKVEHPVSILHDSMLERRLKDVDAGVETIHSGLRSVMEAVSTGQVSIEDQVDEPIPTKMADLLQKEVEDLDNRIQTIQEDINRLIKEYEESEARLQEAIDYGQSEDAPLLSEEDQKRLLEQKATENNNSLSILRQLDAEQKRLDLLSGKRRIKQADFRRAEALDLTVEEYYEIQDAIGRKKVEEALMTQKGLADAYHKPAKERTEEEKEQLRQAKDEIIKEIHKIREEESISVFDAIELLYHLDVEFSEGKNPRVLKVSQKVVDAIHDATEHSPNKVVQDAGRPVVDYEPDAAPADMKDVEHTIRPRVFQEKIALFRDMENGEIYIREYGLDRFNLIPTGASVMINGAVCYPISEEDANRIVERQKNKYSPYMVVSRGIESVQVENRNTQENLAYAVYIKNLLDYTRSHNISVYRYYYDLANHYRDDKEYTPEEFEQNNPFLKEKDYQNLIESKEERMNQYFASAMRRVIDFHLAEYREEEAEKENNQGIDGVEAATETTPENNMSIYRDVDNDDEPYVSEDNLNRLNLEPTSGEVLIEGEPSYRVSNDTIQKCQDDGIKMDVKDVHLGDRKQKDIPHVIERIVLYRDLDNHNEMYVNKYVLNRFHIVPTSEETNVSGRHCFRISEEDVQYIFDCQHNDYSPYTVDVRDVHLGKRDEQKEDNVKEIILYRDLDDNNQLYAPEEVLSYFHLIVETDPITIKETTCHKIDASQEMSIIEEASKSEDPKIEVRYENIHLKKKDKKKEPEIEYIPLFRDTKHDNNIYASFSILNRFGIEPDGEKENILGLECYQLSTEQEDIIKQKVAESTNPKLEIKYIDFELKDKKEKEPEEEEEQKEEKKGKIHYQSVILKLTKGLDSLSTKGAKRFRASNISVSKVGQELRTGNWLYNVFGFVPGLVKLPFVALRKLAAKIMLDAKTKEDYQELQRRLYEDLTEEELEVLFRDYRGNNAKSDNNPQINSFIADRMRSYVLEKVSELNEYITKNYSQLFTHLGEIRVLEEKLEDDSLTDEEREVLELKRKKLVDTAAQLVLNISESRDKGIQLLSGGGFHGFEEDLKAVDSKMSYIGYRFAKTKEFDHEAQEMLAQFGQGFNDAVAKEDNEAILENFMAYEACYFDHTEIENSIFGKRSVGSKYYTPLVEEFNYQDDPFIRNLLSTIAIVSSVTSAINAYRVHHVEGQKLLQDQQREATRVNQANNDAINQAHQVGKNIEGHRQEMMDGMQSQAHHATDEAALGIERHSLDATSTPEGWSLGDAYSAMDQAGHDTYNAFYHDISSRLNDVASRYSTGTINQAQALSEMTQIANDAQSTLNGVVNDCYIALANYAQTHPNFDLTAIDQSMSYILNHPDAIINMNNDIVDIMGEATKLSSLTAEQATVLSALPSDLLTTLITSASAATLALRVSSSMTSKYGHKNQYGNEVIDMMEDYLSEDYEEDEIEEEEEHHHRR